MGYRSVVFAALYVIGSQAYALGWSGWTTVQEYSVSNGVEPLVRLEAPGDAATGCPGAEWVKIKPMEGASMLMGAKFVFSAVQAAMAAGHEVMVFSSECSANFAYISHIQVRKP
ncbi:MAG: hypothetical protein ACPGU7_10930 [Gammaproteobacteria bacterium]